MFRRMIFFCVFSVMGEKHQYSTCSAVSSSLILYHCLDMWIAYNAGERSTFCPSCEEQCLMSLSPI